MIISGPLLGYVLYRASVELGKKIREFRNK